MRQTSALVPYAVASLVIVITSTLALGTTLTAPAAGVPTPTAAGVRAGLSDAGRLAYWRAGPSGVLELWASDLDGGRRWTIATASAGSEVALTRWSVDGSAVAYTVGGTLAVARLDGGGARLGRPSSLSADWKIVSFEWSPDADRIAATLRAANGLGNESDVYVVDARSGALWQRATTLGDAFAGRWIEPGRLFVETAGGMIAVLDVATKTLRPVTGMAATSPLIGRDGRVYFAGGRYVRADVSTQPLADGWVWSATIDGDDLRRETKAESPQMRLFGMLADGRAAIGVPGGVYLAGDEAVALAFPAGTVRRIVVSGDGRRAIGIAESRVLLIDPAKVPRSPGTGSPAAEGASVLLSIARDADVWFPSRPRELAHVESRTMGGPNAKLAFSLGHALWAVDPSGAPRMLLTEPSGLIGPPRWSPSGDSLAVAVIPAGSRGLATVTIVGPDGVVRWSIPIGYAQGLSWTPDGREVAAWIPQGPRNAEWITRRYDADSGRAAGDLAGRAVWSSAGQIVLSDGDIEAGQGVAVGQAIDLIDAAGRRTVTDARRIAASPLVPAAADPSLQSFLSEVVPSADPAYVGVWLRYIRSTVAGNEGSFVVIRLTDGEPVWAIGPRPGQFASDMSWSPSGRLLAWTTEGTGTEARTRHAMVADPATGRTLLRLDGRSAGWAPDGTWIYVARDEGLFAYPIDGGDPVRVGPYGVTVVATRP